MWVLAFRFVLSDHRRDVDRFALDYSPVPNAL